MGRMHLPLLAASVFLAIVATGCGGGSGGSSALLLPAATTAAISGNVVLPNDGNIESRNLSPGRADRSIVKVVDHGIFTVTADSAAGQVSVAAAADGSFSLAVAPGKDVLLTAVNDLKGSSGKIVLYRRIPGTLVAGSTYAAMNLNSDSTAIELCHAKLRQTKTFDFALMLDAKVTDRYRPVRERIEAALQAEITVADVLADATLGNEVNLAATNLMQDLKPAVPAGFNATLNTAETISFTWGAAAYAESYLVYLNSQDAVPVSAATPGYTLASPPAGDLRFFVKSVNAFGISGFSAPFDIVR